MSVIEDGFYTIGYSSDDFLGDVKDKSGELASLHPKEEGKPLHLWEISNLEDSEGAVTIRSIETELYLSLKLKESSPTPLDKVIYKQSQGQPWFLEKGKFNTPGQFYIQAPSSSAGVDLVMDTEWIGETLTIVLHPKNDEVQTWTLERK